MAKFSLAVQSLTEVVRQKLVSQYGNNVSSAAAFQLAKDAGYLSSKRKAGTKLTETGEALLMEFGSLDNVFGAAVVETRFDAETSPNITE